jgi:agmatine deiminase
MRGQGLPHPDTSFPTLSLRPVARPALEVSMAILNLQNHTLLAATCFRLAAASLGVTLLCGTPAGAQVLLPDGSLHYPQGADIPKSLTEIEREYLKRNPITGQLGRGVTAPPAGPIHCASEYAPMEAILVSWRGSSGQQSILAQMARWVTTLGDADVVVVVATTTIQQTAHSTIAAAGANMNRVKFLVRNTDTIWIRDYGPRYIYEGDCRAIVDHQYNRPRPNDNILPVFYASTRGHAFYEIGLGNTQLIHGGGNYHLDNLGRGWATSLINNENPSFTQSQIVGMWKTYQNVDTTITQPFPTSVDLTQHIDMWMQILGDDRVVISNWPLNAGSIQDQICNTTAQQMQGLGYQVFRTPAFAISGVHYTYTNVVVVNDLVLIPTFTHPTVAPYNAAALSAWQQAADGKTVVQINCDALVTSAGVMHCVMMHVPRHRGGSNPTAYLRGPRGGETLTPGQPFSIGWISDDDLGVTSVDLQLSTDGGATFPTAIALNQPRLGSYLWNPPALNTRRARVRVTARDGDNNTGFDQSTANFTIGSPCYANCDESATPPILNVEDFTCFINEFAEAQSLPSEQQTGHYANCDQSTTVPVLNVEDFSCFINKFAAGCP